MDHGNFADVQCEAPPKSRFRSEGMNPTISLQSLPSELHALWLSMWWRNEAHLTAHDLLLWCNNLPFLIMGVARADQIWLHVLDGTYFDMGQATHRAVVAARVANAAAAVAVDVKFSTFTKHTDFAEFVLLDRLERSGGGAGGGVEGGGLRSFALKDSTAVSREQLAQVCALTCHTLEKLLLPSNTDIDDASAGSIALLTSLRHLDLHLNARLTNAGLSEICRATQHLEHLDLGWNHRISDSGVEQLVLHCTALRVLNLNDNMNLSDVSMLHLSHLPFLESLLLDANERVTDAGLHSIADGASSHLRLVSLRSNEKVTWSAVHYLQATQRDKKKSIGVWDGCEVKVICDALEDD